MHEKKMTFVFPDFDFSIIKLKGNLQTLQFEVNMDIT